MKAGELQITVSKLAIFDGSATVVRLVASTSTRKTIDTIPIEHWRTASFEKRWNALAKVIDDATQETDFAGRLLSPTVLVHLFAILRKAPEEL